MCLHVHYVLCSSRYFRLQGLVCEGSEESPIKHLRLLEQLETIDDEEDKLKEIVAIVGCFAFLWRLVLSYQGLFLAILY